MGSPGQSCPPAARSSNSLAAALLPFPGVPRLQSPSFTSPPLSLCSWPSPFPSHTETVRKPFKKKKKTIYGNERKPFQTMQLTRAWSLKYTNHLYNSTAKKKPTTQMKNGQKTWTDISPKKIYWWPTSTWKNAQYHWLLLGKCKSKLLWGTTSHQS